MPSIAQAGALSCANFALDTLNASRAECFCLLHACTPGMTSIYPERYRVHQRLTNSRKHQPVAVWPKSGGVALAGLGNLGGKILLLSEAMVQASSRLCSLIFMENHEVTVDLVAAERRIFFNA